MAGEDHLSEDDRIAAMRLRAVLALWQQGGTMRHDQHMRLPIELRWNHPASRLCVDEALRLVAEPQERTSGEVDWALRDSARDWLESDMVLPSNSDDLPMTHAVYLKFLLHYADGDRNLNGKCARLWTKMFREIA